MGLGQDQLVQRQIRYRLAQPANLKLKILETLDLLDLQTAELLSPAIKRHVTDADLTDRVRHARALRNQNIDLPQFGNDLFRLVSLPLAARARLLLHIMYL